MSYTELQVTTNFSFLRGGSHPEEMVDQAAALGYSAIAITDHNTLAGIVRAYTASKEKTSASFLPAGSICWTGLPYSLARLTNLDMPIFRDYCQKAICGLRKGNAMCTKPMCTVMLRE